MVGGGPVGLAFALAASHLDGVQVCVAEKEPALPARDPTRFDHRVYALSPASRRFLEGLGVWQRMDAARIAAVDAMQVHGAHGGSSDGGSGLEFRQSLPLAHIVEHGALLRVLHAAAEERGERMRRLAGAGLVRLEREGKRPRAVLEDGQTLDADLVIGADGAHSRVRASLGLDVDGKDYADGALVANFQCARTHGHIARQWFLADSVLAWLPLPQQQISIVWSLASARAKELAALDAHAFAHVVAEAGGEALGELKPASPVAHFPLRRQLARHWTVAGAALIGDAAHVVHPLAGQGVNLGFGDAEALCAALRERGSLSAVGDLAVLRRFERARREPALAMAEATDRLRALYLQNAASAKGLRDLGLSTVDRLPFLKRLLMDYAMN